ncbi:MAG: rRNA maturation RNase YbeY [Gammaproteobacteria bacterium]|nr:rRNA maturation RNase YbeY [Gammaproteobacteria bacterium]MBQ0839494.1 rRNA maturation RNase YbeY [Gammaproteobacteria bacterium]
MHANATIDIDNASGEEAPEPPSIRRWISAALGDDKPEAEISVRIVSADESAELNQRYRGKQGPTNVLSFAADIPDFVETSLLGDIVICAAIVRREAAQQHKALEAHWAHMLVHGTLHLLGHDHIEEVDAENMEALETATLGELGFPPPYLPIVEETTSP